MLQTIISTSIFTGAVILIRSIFRKKISSRLTYLLWIAVIIKLCIPFSFISIDIPKIPSFSDTQSDSQLYDSLADNESPETDYEVIPPILSDNTSTEDVPIKEENINNPNVVKPSFDLKAFLFSVWLGGGIITLLIISVSAIVFNVRLIRSRKYHSLAGKTKVYISEYIASPCVSGIIPTIYINTLAATSDKLSLIILHEKTHIKHGDYLWNVFRVLALSAYWWNPLIWAAAILSKRDSELACDEAVISKMNDTDRLTYAAMIVDMIPKKRNIAVGFGNEPIKERIDLLMKGHTKKIIAAVIALVLVILSFGCANIKNVEKSNESTKSENNENDNSTGTNVEKEYKYNSIEDLEKSEHVISVKQYKKLKIEDTLSYEVILNISEKDLSLYISAPINYKAVSYPTTIHFPEITPMHENYATLFAANGCISISYIDYNSMESPFEQALSPIDTMMEILNECSFIDTEKMVSTASGINSYLPFLIANKYTTNIKGIAVIDAVCNMTAQHDHNEKSAALFEYYLGGSPEAVPDCYSLRSAISYASSIKCPVLIMNYLQNPDFSLNQANEMKAAMDKSGGKCTVVTFDELNSDFHSTSAASVLTSFINQIFNDSNDESSVKVEISSPSSLYDSLAPLINDGKTEKWQTYTIETTGLPSTVTLEMEHDSLLKSITAYGHTINSDSLSDTNYFLFGNINTRLYEFDEAIIFSRYYYDSGDTVIFTEEDFEHIKPDDDTCITINIDDTGKLTYKKAAIKYNATINQDMGAPVLYSESRDDFYYEEGTATIENGKLITHKSNSYTISDKFDLDEIFEQLKSEGYPEVKDYDSLDELLESNKNK